MPDGRSFGEEFRTRRVDVGSVARHVLGSATTLTLRGSATEEWRTHGFGADRERDRRNTLFGEAALTMTRASQAIVAGAAVERDAYRAPDVARMDYDYLTPGIFAQHLWTPTPWFSLSTSARLDLHNVYGDYLSPRISALIHPGSIWNARISAGMGVYAPTPFTEETEVTGLVHLRPIGALIVERARSVSVDVSGTFGSMEVDGSLFATAINHPVALRAVPDSAPQIELVNAGKPTRGGGAELFARYRLEPLSIAASYTFLQQTELDVESGARRDVPLNPRHAGGLTVVWEEEDDWRAGIELYYTGRQTVTDDPYRSVTVPYVYLDALIQRRFGPVVVFLHGENLNDVRQTRFDPLLRPTPGLGGRWTTDVWAPLEGGAVNLGIRWRY